MAFADRRCSKIHRICAWSNHARNVPKLAAKVHHDGPPRPVCDTTTDARSRGFVREAGVVIGAKNQTLVFRTLGGGRSEKLGRAGMLGGPAVAQRDLHQAWGGPPVVCLIVQYVALFVSERVAEFNNYFRPGRIVATEDAESVRPPKNMLPRRVDLPIHRPLQGWRDVERFPKFFSGGFAPSREGGRPGSHLPLRAKRFFRWLVRFLEATHAPSASLLRSVNATEAAEVLSLRRHDRWRRPGLIDDRLARNVRAQRK